MGTETLVCEQQCTWLALLFQPVILHVNTLSSTTSSNYHFRMSGKSTPKTSTPRSTPPRMTPTRTSPPRGTTPTRLHASKIALTQAKVASPPAVGHPHSHSLSMLGAERYQNQLSSTANAELFNGKKKNPSMYRRPSELGLSTTPMADQSEVRSNYQPVAMGRQHIVKPIPDHKETYQGAVEKDSEVRATYKDLQAKRPICQKLIDHTEEIQPKEDVDETSEYRSTINKLEDMQIEGVVLKGERALPPWLNMQKVSPFGTNPDVTRE